MHLKSGSDDMKFLLAKKLVKPEVPLLEDKHTTHNKKVWNDEDRKSTRGNLCSHFMVLMALCDADTENQVDSTEKISDLEKKMNSIGL